MSKLVTYNLLSQGVFSLTGNSRPATIYGGEKPSRLPETNPNAIANVETNRKRQVTA